MLENRHRWSDTMDNAIESGSPLKAGATAMTSYFPATFEMMRTGEFKQGLGLLLLSFVGFPAAVISATVLAIINRKQ